MHDLDTAQVLDSSEVAREERCSRNRREHGAFERTQAPIARTLESGRAADLPRVPYVFGPLHLARATARTGIDRPQRLGELDRAIDRVDDTLGRMPHSPTALAVLIDAYIRKGVSAHETASGMSWMDARGPTQPAELGRCMRGVDQLAFIFRRS
jgi:hypothetical protein